MAQTPSEASSHICVYLISFRAFLALLLDVTIELGTKWDAHNEPNQGPGPGRDGRRLVTSAAGLARALRVAFGLPPVPRDSSLASILLPLVNHARHLTSI